MRTRRWSVALGAAAAALALFACQRSRAMAGPAASPAAADTRGPRLDALKAEVHAFHLDWTKRGIDAAFARVSTGLREQTTPAKMAALLQQNRDTMGDYVGLEGGQLIMGGKAEGQALVVLDVTVRYTRESATSHFAFVEEGGAWRLRGFGPRAALPDDATVTKAARAVLDGVVREGAMSLLSRTSAETREGEGEARLRRKFSHVAAIFGGMRSYELDEPTFGSLTCRGFKGTADFEHGRGRVTMQLCSESGAWMLQSMDVVPESLTGAFFERAIAFELAPGGHATVTCPDGVVAVGAEITCRVARGSEKVRMRVRRTSETGMEVVGASLE